LETPAPTERRFQVWLSIEQLLYDPYEGLNDDPAPPTHVRECYEILAGPVVNLPIQIQWNNGRMAKAKEIIARANERAAKASGRTANTKGKVSKTSQRVVKAHERIADGNKKIAEAKAYLRAAVERCKATYGEADTAIALEALMENVGVTPTVRRENALPHPSALLLAYGKKSRTIQAKNG
jgi:hypothetical protein